MNKRTRKSFFKGYRRRDVDIFNTTITNDEFCGEQEEEDFGILTPQAHTETIFQSGSNSWNHKTINYDTNHRQKQYEQ